jgi:hypothetical protein
MDSGEEKGHLSVCLYMEWNFSLVLCKIKQRKNPLSCIANAVVETTSNNAA